jgi:hypothetical protein
LKEEEDQVIQEIKKDVNLIVLQLVLVSLNQKMKKNLSVQDHQVIHQILTQSQIKYHKGNYFIIANHLNQWKIDLLN